MKYNFEKIVYTMKLCFALSVKNLKSEFGFFIIGHEISAEWVRTEIMDPTQQFS